MGQEEVHIAIWSNIHRKHFYLAQQAPICAGMLQEEFRYNANTVVAEQVLKDEYIPEQPIDAASYELFNTIAEIRKEVQEDTISTNITHRQWADFWGKFKEETLFYRSGRPFGQYIAGALLKIISHFHAVKTSIVLRRGISLERWSLGLSIMLEKVKGCSLVSNWDQFCSWRQISTAPTRYCMESGCSIMLNNMD
jgi:hypothetical protein